MRHTHVKMEEEEDDFYAPNGETTAAKIEQANGHAVTQDEDMGALVYNDEDDEGDEDQEDDEDEDDSVGLSKTTSPSRRY